MMSGCAEERFMLRAFRLAEKAASMGEVPVGAVIVKDGRVIATGYNKRETSKNALAHAEIVAINRACRRLGGWRLHTCDIYVTLEPCPMCAGAIINSRIRTVYIGARDSVRGAFGSLCDLSASAGNYHPDIRFGYLEEECSSLLTGFFRKLRQGAADV